VWHASAAPLAGHIVTKPTLHQRALTVLEGVGDREHEWHEWSGYAYHIRRRLRAEEASRVGEVRDIRGTREAYERYNRMAVLLPLMTQQVAREELRTRPPAGDDRDASAEA
jgi:hypothetical protein